MFASDDSERLRGWLERCRRLFVLTGAGCSTASGIPDYRDDTGAWKRRPPVMYQAFCSDEAVYRRYWARAFAGWPQFSAARPGPAHIALARLERTGTMTRLVTQNVDRLHQRAGSQAVVDLHGRLDLVVCLGCRDRSGRAALQDAIATINPGWAPVSAIAPDGDADIAPAAVESFVAPRCPHCDGRLKPDVVFFGENVPPPRYDEARTALEQADGLLVVGSSLMVYSGYRFAQQASAAGVPIAIVNRGRTRADALAELKLEGDAGALLMQALADVTA